MNDEDDEFHLASLAGIARSSGAAAARQ